MESIYFMFVVVVQVLLGGIFIGRLTAAINSIKDNIKELKGHIKDDMTRLETKQDKHNGLIERMTIVEQSSKSAHHRIDDFKNRK